MDIKKYWYKARYKDFPSKCNIAYIVRDCKIEMRDIDNKKKEITIFSCPFIYSMSGRFVLMNSIGLNQYVC